MSRTAKNYQLPTEVDAALMKLTQLVSENQVIKQYRLIEAQVKASETLTKLQADLITAQKEIVNYDHYHKPNAKALAVQKADELKIKLDTHPLVISYRQALYEANELLQWLQTTLQTEIDTVLTPTIAKGTSEEKDAAKNK